MPVHVPDGTFVMFSSEACTGLGAIREDTSAPCSNCPYSPKYLEEEIRFSVSGGVRPVGGIQGRLVQVVIRELDQQRVAPLIAGQEAQPPHVLRPGRGGRLEEPVPDGVRPRPREVLDRTLQERPGHVVSPGARREVEQIARVAGGATARLQDPQSAVAGQR